MLYYAGQYIGQIVSIDERPGAGGPQVFVRYTGGTNGWPFEGSVVWQRFGSVNAYVRVECP